MHHVPIDIDDAPYAAHVLLYILFGLSDAMWQTLVYWLMGALANDTAKLAYLNGFCASPTLSLIFDEADDIYRFLDKAIQSAGDAGAFRADAVGTPYVYF